MDDSRGEPHASVRPYQNSWCVMTPQVPTAQKTISRKSDLKPVVAELETYYLAGNESDFWYLLETEILQHRVRFPLLEYVARELVQVMPAEAQLNFTDRLVTKPYQGEYVLLAIVLQERMAIHLSQSFSKAEEYIIMADKWYACDNISERVCGEGLLRDFATAVSLIRANTTHPNHWLVRSTGVATHYATKKGLAKENVATLFETLMPAAQTKDYFAKKGVGWAFKTIAKFHPDIVQPQLEAIQNDPTINSWCKQKLKIGLSMAQKRTN